MAEGGGALAQPRLAGTLRAAVVDETVADELRRGVLSTDHEAPAFGFASGVDAGPASTSPKRPSKAAPTSRTGKPSAAERAAAVEAEKAERDRVAEEERQRFEARRRRAEQERELERLERSADRLARRADQAQAAADEARAKADAAATLATEARATLDA